LRRTCRCQSQADRDRGRCCRHRSRSSGRRAKSPCPAIPRETPNPACPSPKPAETMPSPRSSIAVAGGGYRLPTQFCTTSAAIPYSRSIAATWSKVRMSPYIFSAVPRLSAWAAASPAPADFAHHDRCEVEVEDLADARLDAAIGGAAADDDGVAPQHVRELGESLQKLTFPA